MTQKGWVEPGKIFSKSGRELQAVPQHKNAARLIKLMDTWLRDQAIDEAAANHDNWNGFLFCQTRPDKLTNAERSLLNDYVFGDPDGISLEGYWK